jgi:parallel beta-helix repeat protein
MGTFPVQEQRRFIIENLCEALVPNSFCFVNETKTVYLMTDGSYDPAKEQIITSVKEIVVSIAGEDVDKPIEDIIVDNIAIQHGAWNIDRNEKADAGAAGFLNCAALFIENAISVVVSNVEISHTGSYGLWITQGTTNINFLNSLITDTGAGGIRSGTWAIHTAPSSAIKIISNEISYGGNEFPSGVGIVLAPASGVVVASNIIHHQRYDGIAIYSQDGYGEVWMSDILVQGNYIYDIGQHILCDQGGIYTTGIQSGTVIDGNVIKNVFSYAVLMWGIYLDDGSSNIIVSNNIVYNTGWAAMFQHYGANNTIINNVFARASLIQPPQPGDWPPDGDVRIQVAENHTSWTFTRNIVYDTFQGSSHIAYNTVNGTIAPFTNNVYYNPYGTQLLFGPEQTSFEKWQKTGQDNGSVLADPLFMGDVSQCDFFTISFDSPAAKLGFANLTKLSIWTPGCDMNDTTTDIQFYHW